MYIEKCNLQNIHREISYECAIERIFKKYIKEHVMIDPMQKKGKKVRYCTFLEEQVNSFFKKKTAKGKR